MNRHVEDKLTGWALGLKIHGWILAIFIFLTFLGASINFEDTFLLLVGIVIALDYVGFSYFFAWLIFAFAEITRNARETTLEIRQLNINIQKAFLENIQATEKTMAENARMEREQAERERQEMERKETERKQAATRRKEEYWLAHAEEKEALLAKREQARRALHSGKLPAKEKSQLEELIQKIDAELNRDR